MSDSILFGASKFQQSCTLTTLLCNMLLKKKKRISTREEAEGNFITKMEHEIRL